MKSHFQFSNQQRNGIFLLLLVIITSQCVYWFVPNLFSNTSFDFTQNQNQLEAFKKELDSLRLIKIAQSKPNIYPFNPNYITDYKGYTLGMTNEEIDRLHAFRATDQWVNSVSQFQKVTKVSDSLLKIISPYFKFPSWVNQSQSQTKAYSNAYANFTKPKNFKQKIDLNIATAAQLKKVYGVGEKLSQRIVAYRNKFKGGFIADIELSEVYGLSPEVITRIQNDFTVKTPRVIKKIHLNTATRDQLVNIQYIDYEIAHHIIEERTIRDGFKSLEELLKVEDFPVKKIEIIKLYLQL